jgi:ATP-dependent Lhr-like helicase
MHPVISEWFKGKFGKVTEAQSMAVPLIHARKSVLVSSPTGSGKTLTAFLSILNELTLLSERGQLEDRIYAVYISPLKALANDINENLLKPLKEISDLFESKGKEPPRVKVAVRTGDTLPSERQRHAREPPHIFITTPESLALVLSTPVFSKKFEKVDWLIIDEVHEVCDSKRGVALSLAVERLQNICERPLVRIGLSATVAPLDQVAEFLAGMDGGKPRNMNIVEVFQQRDLDLKVISPAKDMTALSFEVVNSKMYDLLKELIDQHRTTLIFTNTRSGTESVVYKLKERGVERIGAHHGSLSRETRLDVENALRSGELRAVVSSTSLELGIDIGHIDLVVQIGSPKSVAKGVQRIGRSGHMYRGTSKGRIAVFEPDDLVECAVLCRAAHKKLIDRVTIPVNCLDVLAQTLVGLSIEKKWNADEAYALVRRSYCYKDLTRAQFESVLRYLGGKDEFEGVYSKLWYDEKERAFGKKRGSRMIFYLNQGTIPEEADYKVFSERGSLIGSLSEKFVERLSAGDIFVLGGRSYEFIKSKGTKAFVKSASGRKPTVPSWTGEMLPRSFDLSVLIGEFRKEMDNRLGRLPDKEIHAWLMKEYDVDDGSATTILNYFKEQRAVSDIPTNDRLIIEGYVDASGNKSAVFHYPFGRRVNDALSRAYAHVLSQHLKANVTVSVTDDSFMLTAPKAFRVEDLGGLLRSDQLEPVLRSAVRDSELFHQRFRHTATRAFMVLRNYKGKALSVARQQLRSSRLLDALHEIADFPVMIETYDEILREVMDIEHASQVLASIELRERSVDYMPFGGVPSPFAHNVILVGVSDIVLMEDRSMLLRELHRKVLARVLGEEAVTGYQFDADAVEEYFEAKFPQIGSKDDILAAVRVAGPMNVFREKGESIYSHTKEPFDRVNGWALELLHEGKIRSVWIGEEVYVAAEDHATYSCLHRREIELTQTDESILAMIEKEPQSIQTLTEDLGLVRDDVRDSIHHLESANHIFRTDTRSGAFLYSETAPGDRARSSCMLEAVRRHLAFHAPMTVEDVAYEVGLTEPETDETLRELVAQEAVVAGRFVVGEQQQYMLAKDYLRLKGAGPVYDRETIRAYSERKQFAVMSSIRAFFDKFGEAGMMYDIFQRVKDFDMSEFGQMRSKGELLLGRFLRGRIRYVMAEDAPYYLGVFRREGLNKYEAEILRVIRKLGSGTFIEIQEASGFPPDAMREHFDSLDRKGYLLRRWDEAESWSSRNVYEVYEEEPKTEGAHERVALRYLTGFGPVTALQAAAYLDIEPDEAVALLKKVGAAQITVGLERTEMYALSAEVAELDVAVPQDSSLRILSLYDPFLSDKWTEITSRYGEGWFFPLVKGGRIAGMVEKWLLAGSVEIREIQLDDPELLDELAVALDSMMRFYNTMGVEILRIRSVLGVSVDELDSRTRTKLLDRDYVESNGMLVKGRLVTPSYELPEVLATVFSQQHLEEGTRLDDMDSAIERFGGLRSNSEAILRVRKFESIQRLHKRGQVVRGHMVPDRVGYTSIWWAGVYMAARRGDLSAHEKLVMRIVKDQQPIKRDRLLDLSPLGHTDTVDAMKELYTSSRLYLDGALSYIGTKRVRMTREGARARIVTQLFEVYGLMTAEALGTMLGHELSMRELRKILRRLEDGGLLVKGYLLRGSGTLYWCTRNAFERIGKADFKEGFVLSPEDNLTQYLRASFRDLMPDTGRHAVFLGSNMIGSFEGKVHGNKLLVSDIQGGPECEELIDKHARKLGLALADRGEGRISDWEIMDFYQRTHPGVKENSARQS